MKKVFVFGKFLPFHKGHEALIRFALQQSDWLSVLVCCSDRESIPCELRSEWIRQTFAGNSRLEVLTFHYHESELSSSSESSPAIAAAWSEIFGQLFPGYELVITSEPYGKLVADSLNIRHLSFNPDRTIVPVSATQIRRDPSRYWDYLPESVKPYFSLKVVLLGTESTGKSCLTERLARHFGCNKVDETARELVLDSCQVRWEDLALVAAAHNQRIEKASRGSSRLLLIDTDIHTTMSYAQFLFGRALTKQDYPSSPAHLYLYLDRHVPYVQDGTRLPEPARNGLDEVLLQVLKEHNIPYLRGSGDWEARFESCRQYIEALLTSDFGQRQHAG